MPRPDPTPAQEHVVERLSGREMMALIAAGNVVLAAGPSGDPLRMDLRSAVQKLKDAAEKMPAHA